MNKPIFEWNEELGHASCIIEDGENVFYGDAQCHDDDEDMKSEKTGLEIAYKRAYIDTLTYLRDNDIKPQLKAYKQLYYSMNKSKRFNPKSYENIMLQRKIREKENDLTTVSNMLVGAKENLKEYIKVKDELYNKIRKNRNKDKNN